MSIAVNLGCGLYCSPEWVNVDNSPTILLAKLPLVNRFFPRWPKGVVRASAANLPFESHSVSYVYSSHMLEHLTRDRALVVLQECHRILARGGILRIAVPDLRLQIQ
jgi:predicted SAM-dependent methyltransferase